MREQSNQDSPNSGKKIKPNPSNPKYDSPKTIPPEVSENDQDEFSSEDGDELNFDSEIEGDRSDQTEVDLDRSGMNQNSPKQPDQSHPSQPQ